MKNIFQQPKKSLENCAAKLIKNVRIADLDVHGSPAILAPEILVPKKQYLCMVLLNIPVCPPSENCQ